MRSPAWLPPSWPPRRGAEPGAGARHQPGARRPALDGDRRQLVGLRGERQRHGRRAGKGGRADIGRSASSAIWTRIRVCGDRRRRGARRTAGARRRPQRYVPLERPEPDAPAPARRPRAAIAGDATAPARGSPRAASRSATRATRCASPTQPSAHQREEAQRAPAARLIAVACSGIVGELVLGLVPVRRGAAQHPHVEPRPPGARRSTR